MYDFERDLKYATYKNGYKNAILKCLLNENLKPIIKRTKTSEALS